MTRNLCTTAAFLVAVLPASCISGRVLEGYPGYPFLRFESPLAVDSTFFELQRAIVAEGFELDFTEREAGLINTRPADRLGRQVLLSIVVGTDPAREDTVSTAGPTPVWIAGYVRTRNGDERIDPLAKEAWADLAGIAARLSDRLGGTSPAGPSKISGNGTEPR